MTPSPYLAQMPPDQLRALAAQLLSQVETMGHTVETMSKTVETMGKKINRDQTLTEKLTHEIAQRKRLKFAKRSEQMNPEHASLLDDLIDTDIAAVEAEFHALQIAPVATEKKQKTKRTPLPTEFPRAFIHHEPDNTHCPCGCALKRIGDDICEKLDYTPGASSSNYMPPTRASLPSRPWATSNCCTKSKAKCATWSQIYGAEYGKKKPSQ